MPRMDTTDARCVARYTSDRRVGRSLEVLGMLMVGYLSTTYAIGAGLWSGVLGKWGCMTYYHFHYICQSHHTSTWHPHEGLCAGPHPLDVIVALRKSEPTYDFKLVAWNTIDAETYARHASEFTP